MRPRVWLGLFVLAAGVGLLLDRLAVWDFGTVLADWWPAILIAVGLIQLTQAPERFVGPVVLVALGGVLLAHRHGVLPGDWTKYLTPAALILLGAWLMTTGRSALPERTRRGLRSGEAWIERSAIFGGVELATDVRAFRGGALTAIFGGIEADLREARLHREGADLEATAVFGGVKLRVPESWAVIVEGTPIFADVDDARQAHEPREGEPVLRVHATALFGGVEIES